MRAALLSAYGPPENLEIREVATPRVERPDDVRVAVHAAAINPVDWKIRSGRQRGFIRYKLPWILGLDVSGEVLEVGSAVRRFRVGDLVYGCLDHRRNGSYAEECVTESGCLAPKPASVSHIEAASLPLVGLTAWQCLLPKLELRREQRVLIQAGSGGVGTFAIQLAKHHGAWVAATCSEPNHALVKELGADRAIDYRSENWWELLSELDLILDALGGEERERALRSVRRGGRMASIVLGLPTNTEKYGPVLGGAVTAWGLGGLWLRGRLRGVEAVSVVRRNNAGQLVAIGELVDRGVIRPVIDHVFPLEAIVAAHRMGEAGRIRGKVVLQVRDRDATT